MDRARANINKAFDLRPPFVKPPQPWYVSLMEAFEYYGGVDDGDCWWSWKYKVVKSKKYKTYEEARQALNQVKQLAYQLTCEEAQAFRKQFPEIMLNPEYEPDTRGVSLYDYHVLDNPRVYYARMTPSEVKVVENQVLTYEEWKEATG